MWDCLLACVDPGIQKRDNPRGLEKRSGNIERRHCEEERKLSALEEPQEPKLGIAALSAFTEASLVQGIPPMFAPCEVISPLQMGAVTILSAEDRRWGWGVNGPACSHKASQQQRLEQIKQICLP